MNKKILIIDDEVDLANLLKLQLEAEGYEVIYANDGDIGLYKAENEAPNIVILDLNLPKLGGFWVCKALKSQEKFKKISIIVLTGFYKSKKDEEQVLALGADAYMEKPFKAKVLLNKIKELMERQV